MPLTLQTVPCLSDNYAFLLHDSASGETAVVDVPEAAPIEAALQENGWQLTQIVITHHHADHIDGVDRLRQSTGAKVVGAAADSHRLPDLDQAVEPGQTIRVCGAEANVLDVPGHTVGHIAFHLPDERIAFTGDSLMALGCGRLFEGTPEQMWRSLSQFRDMPGDTRICSGHEYTSNNASFAVTVDPDNDALKERASDVSAARAEGRATVPSMLSAELKTNPFLRPDDGAIRAELGMKDEPDVAVFAEIRRRKDSF